MACFMPISHSELIEEAYLCQRQAFLIQRAGRSFDRIWQGIILEQAGLIKTFSADKSVQLKWRPVAVDVV